MKNISKRIVTLCVAAMLALTLCTAAACKKPQNENVGPVYTYLDADYSAVKTEFEYGEPFTYEGLKVKQRAESGEEEELQLGSVTVVPPQMTPGQHMVEIKYGELSAKYPIFVNDLKKPYDDTGLAKISGAGTYTAEFEKIDLEKSQVSAADEKAAVVKRTNSALISGGAYLTNVGVKGNCIGFAYTSNKDYANATVALRVGNNENRQVKLSDSIAVYSNFGGSEDTGELDISSVPALAAGSWATIAADGVRVSKGENNIIVEMKDDAALSFDCVKITAGTTANAAASVAIKEDAPAVLEAEDFNTEKLLNDDAVAAENNLTANQPLVTDYEGGKYISGMKAGSIISALLTTKNTSVVKIEMKAETNDGYGVAENFSFMIDDCVLDGVEQSGDGWNSVNLGSYKLAAGEHLFRVKLTGDCCNIDNFTFTVVEDDETLPVIEDNSEDDLFVYGHGTHRVEAEKMLDRSGWVPQFGTVEGMVESWYHKNGDKGYCVSKVKVGTVMRLTFNLKKQSKFTLSARVCKDGSPTINPTDIDTKINETSLKWSTSDTFGHSDDTNWWKWGTVNYAPVLLEAGEYTIAIKVTDVGVDFFDLKFEEPTDLHAETYGKYKVEAENLFDRSGWVPQHGEVDGMIEEWYHNNGDRGFCVSKIKSGTVLRITVSFEQSVRLALSARVCKSGAEVINPTDALTTVDGRTISWRTVDVFGKTDATNWWKWGTLTYEPIILDAGKYVIEIKSVDIGVDWFEFECSDPSADLVISEFKTYRFEAEDMLDKSGWKAQSGNRVDQMIEAWSWKDGTKGFCVGKTTVGHVYRMKLLVEKPCSIAMRARICRDGGDIWNSNFNMSIGGTAYKFIKDDANFKFGHDDAKNYWNWGTVRWDAVNCEAGVIIIEITSANQFSANADWFEFTVAEPLPATPEA